jgi:hypothetical protein
MDMRFALKIYIASVYAIISLTPFSHANIFDATAKFCQRARVTAETAASITAKY